MITTDFFNVFPASFAAVRPAEPPPTTTKSYNKAPLVEEGGYVDKACTRWYGEEESGEQPMTTEHKMKNHQRLFRLDFFLEVGEDGDDDDDDDDVGLYSNRSHSKQNCRLTHNGRFL
jgi:hypothetical protein